MNGYFYGVCGIELVWHGEWSDPELIWNGYSFNYYDLEMPLWEDFLEEFPEAASCKNADQRHFKKWVKEHEALCFEYLENLLECECFYGSKMEV